MKDRLGTGWVGAEWGCGYKRASGILVVMKLVETFCIPTVMQDLQTCDEIVWN